MKYRLLLTACFLSVFMMIFGITAEGSTTCRIEDMDELCGVYRYSDNDFVIVMKSGGNYCAAISAGEQFTVYNTGMSADTNAYCYVDGMIYFFGNDIESDGVNIVYIYIYDCAYNSKEKRVINCDTVITQNSAAADRYGNIYLINGRAVELYTNYKLTDTVRTDGAPISLTAGADGEVIYCVTTDGVAAVSCGYYIFYPVQTDCVYPTEGGFSDSSGVLYNAKGEYFEEVFSGFDGSNGSAAAGDVFLGVKSGRLTAYYNEKESVVCELYGSAHICAGGSRFAAVVPICGGADVIFFECDEVYAVDTGNSLVQADDKKNAADYILENFRVEDNILYGIQPSSTVAAIKARLAPKDSTVVFFDKNGKVKTSGTVGTGCTVTVTSGDESVEYRLLVFGDISGEGNVNKTDKTSLANSLLTRDMPEGLFADASDINHDGRVDLIDLSAMNMYLNGEYEIKQELYK